MAKVDVGLRVVRSGIIFNSIVVSSSDSTDITSGGLGLELSQPFFVFLSYFLDTNECFIIFIGCILQNMRQGSWRQRKRAQTMPDASFGP